MEKVLKTFFCLLALGLILSFLVNVSGRMQTYNEKRIFELVVLILSAIVFIGIRNKEHVNSFSFSRYPVLYIILLGLLLCSIMFSPSIFYALVEVGIFILLGILAYLIALGYLKDHRVVELFFYTALLFSVLYLYKFFLGTYFFAKGAAPLWPGSGFDSVIYGFANKRYFTQVQVWTLPLILGSVMLLQKRNKLWGWVAMVMPIFWWFLILRTEGRGATLSILGAVILLVFFYKKHAYKWAWLFLVSFVGGLFIEVVIFRLLFEFGAVEAVFFGGNSRLTVWPEVFSKALESPIWGYGPLSFASLSSGFYWGHPHNSVLQVIYEFGFPLAIATILCWLYSAFKWVGQTQQVSKEIIPESKEMIIRVSLSSSLFAGFAYSLFSGVIVMPISQLWMAIIIGLILGIYLQKRESFNEISPPVLFPFKTIIAGFALILMIVLVRDVPKQQTLSVQEKEYLKEHNNRLKPRLWQQGKFGDF